VAATRPTAADRRREERVRLGTGGLLLVFAGGLGVVVSPENGIVLLGVMVAGLALLAIAFVLVRTPVADLLRLPPER